MSALAAMRRRLGIDKPILFACGFILLILAADTIYTLKTDNT